MVRVGRDGAEWGLIAVLQLLLHREDAAGGKSAFNLSLLLPPGLLFLKKKKGIEREEKERKELTVGTWRDVFGFEVDVDGIAGASSSDQG